MKNIAIKGDFIYVMNKYDSWNIINKKYIINVEDARLPGHTVIHLCYPGMRETEVVAKVSIDEFWENL